MKPHGVRVRAILWHLKFEVAGSRDFWGIWGSAVASDVARAQSTKAAEKGAWATSPRVILVCADQLRPFGFSKIHIPSVMLCKREEERRRTMDGDDDDGG